MKDKSLSTGTMLFLIGVIVVSILMTCVSCTKEQYFENMPLVRIYKEGREFVQTHAGEPTDWTYNPPVSQPIEIDTPCVPQQYDQPAFVSGWWFPQIGITTDIEVCVYPYCQTIQSSDQIGITLYMLLNQFDNTLEYQVYVSDLKTVAFVAKGTNDRNRFQGKVWVRPASVHSGWGFECNTQAFFFLDAISFDQYMTNIDSLPSFDKFTFQYTNWDSLQYIQAFDKILECRIGRSYADLRYLPFTFPDSVYQKFEDAGWDTVLN